MVDKWTKRWPKKEGVYWFYSYRYGKTSCGCENKPELMLMEVRQGSNYLFYIANGQFVEKDEPEEARFMKFIPPKLPEI